MFLRPVLPTLVKLPPRYTLEPTALIAYTGPPVTFGFHGSSAPVVRFTAAAPFRVTAPAPVEPDGSMAVNWPPM